MEPQGIDLDLSTVEEPTEEEIEKEDKTEEVERLEEMALDAHPLA
jgi:hypothetical protein